MLEDIVRQATDAIGNFLGSLPARDLSWAIILVVAVPLIVAIWVALTRGWRQHA